MNDREIEILTKVYGYVNKIKVRLTFKDINGIWKVINELSDYLVSIDVSETTHLLNSPTEENDIPVSPI